MYCFFNKFFFKVEIFGNLPIFCHAHLVAIQDFVDREILFDRCGKCPMLCLFFDFKWTISAVKSTAHVMPCFMRQHSAFLCGGLAFAAINDKEIVKERDCEIVFEFNMEEIFKPLWKQTYDEGTRIAKQAYNIRGVDRPELLSQAKLRGGQRVRHVTQTTKENISRIVANGIEAGIGREKMADEILQEYEIQTRSRARLIADQETVMTLETGHYDMMQKSGATTKTWHHRPQKNPRDGSDGGPNHVKMDGETVPIDARFSNGLRYPCDPEGPARETIKCRCYVTYNR